MLLSPSYDRFLLLAALTLDRHISVDDPDEHARREVFEIHTRDRSLAEEVDRDGGAVWVEDSEIGGAQFVVGLPRAVAA